MKKINLFFKKIISAIYPNKCICCSEIIDEGNYLCSNCYKSIERNLLNDICFSCGFEKDECVCKYNIYRFNSLICVFKNKGLARRAYYSYKFSKRQHYVNFFADEMCKSVKQCYNDIEFDFICSVPPANRFGYNHCGYLAKEMSKILNIPYIDDLLLCVKKTKKQHKSSIKERINNIEGKYKCKFNIKNAQVLLVDDIKTTGSTIDECTKMLLFAGAKSVHCITTLGTSQSKELD